MLQKWIINQACKALMPRKKRHKNRDAADWWNDEIAELRRECLKRRRQAIKKSKRQSWGTLSREVDDDPWGLGYKIVTRKLGAFSASILIGAESMRHIVDVLFPTHPEREKDYCKTPLREIPLFSE